MGKKALYTGKPAAKSGSRSGSRYYPPPPQWVLDELDKPASSKTRRLRDPVRGPGLTIDEAATALGRGTTSIWRLIKHPQLILGNKALENWKEYLLEPGGTLLYVRVVSAQQIEQIKKERARQQKEFQDRKGLTDIDVMRKYPHVFAKRAKKELHKPVSRMTALELKTYRPGLLSNWRNEDFGCPHLPDRRHIAHWVEGGRIVNDADDIEIIAKALQGASLPAGSLSAQNAPGCSCHGHGHGLTPKQKQKSCTFRLGLPRRITESPRRCCANALAAAQGFSREMDYSIRSSVTGIRERKAAPAGGPSKK